MTYLITSQNAVQAPLSGKAPSLVTDGISDPIVRQNFEILNKFYQEAIKGNPRNKSNLVFSKPYFYNGATLGFTGISTKHFISQLQLQISTLGNPVRIRLAPILLDGTSSATIDTTTPDTVCSGLFGFVRNGSTIVSRIVLSQQILPAPTAFSIPITLPSFETTDVVPAGDYTYQFYYQLLTARHTLTIQNVCLEAYELR